MAGACEHADLVFNVETMIAEFLADTKSSALQLPCTDAGQRKLTKKLVEKHSNLTCKSYGFGQDRQMHLFKKSRLSDRKATAGASTVTVKNTFIDDWLDAEDVMEHETVLFRSMPPSLSPHVPMSCSEENDSALGVSFVKEVSHTVRRPWDATSEDRSTAASSSRSASGSPKGSTRELLAKPPGLSTPIAGLKIRHTFFNFELPPSDERAVQSMPHGMFRQALCADALSEQVAEGALLSPKATINCTDSLFDATPERFPSSVGDGLLVFGTEVMISGLQKCPAFNGLRATVQAFDTEIERYEVSLVMPEGGRKLAKIKRENILLVAPSPPVQFSPKLAPTREMKMSFSGMPIVPPAYVGRERRSSKQTLKLTALV